VGGGKKRKGPYVCRRYVEIPPSLWAEERFRGKRGNFGSFKEGELGNGRVKEKTKANGKNNP